MVKDGFNLTDAEGREDVIGSAASADKFRLRRSRSRLISPDSAKEKMRKLRTVEDLIDFLRNNIIPIQSLDYLRSVFTRLNVGSIPARLLLSSDELINHLEKYKTHET